MVFFKGMLLVVCVLSILGAGFDMGEGDSGRLKGYVALFAVSGTLFLASWALTTILGV